MTARIRTPNERDPWPRLGEPYEQTENLVFWRSQMEVWRRCSAARRPEQATERDLYPRLGELVEPVRSNGLRVEVGESNIVTV